MTEEEIRSLIAGGETLTTEFKSDRGSLGDTDLLEAVTCLSNTRGGVLLIGVENSGRITGLESPHKESQSHALAAVIQNNTVPPLGVTVSMVDLPEGRVAAIHVPAAPQLVATNRGRVLFRVLDARGKPQCRPMFPAEFDSWYADRGQRDVTARVMTGTTWSDLDPLEFVRLRQLLNDYRGDASLQELSDQELARALGLVSGENFTPTLAGLLVVGRENVLRKHVSTHEVAFQVLRGDNVAVNEFYHGSLLKTFDRITQLFSVRNEETEVTVGLFRVGIPAYDVRAFREAVNNAFTHRDYSRMDGIYIQMYDEEVIIINPGGFVEGVRIDALLTVGPRPRNPLLADIFKRIGLVERTGRGIRLIYAGLLRTGRLPPDYSRTTEQRVTVRLPGGPADLKFVQVIVKEEAHRTNPLTVSELLILHYLHREREIDIIRAARLIQQDEANARRVLEGLVESGLIERRGTQRDRTYILSSSMYRQLGKKAEYIRRRGFESIQNEQMAIQYIRENGSIARRDLIELCRMTKGQASYFLKKLEARGVVQLASDSLPVGAGVRYILPETKNDNTMNDERRNEKRFTDSDTDYSQLTFSSE